LKKGDKMNNNEIFLFLNPHPDDVEISVSGTIFKYLLKNKSNIWICYLTRGDLLMDKRIESTITSWRTVMNCPDLHHLVGHLKFLEIGIDELTIRNNMRGLLSNILCEISNINDLERIFIFSPPYESLHPDHHDAAILSMLLQICLSVKKGFSAQVIHYLDSYTHRLDIKSYYEMVINELEPEYFRYKMHLLDSISSQLNRKPKEIIDKNIHYIQKLVNNDSYSELFLYRSE